VIETFLFVGVGLALLLTLLWLAGRPVAPPLTPTVEAKLEIEDLFTLHCRYFPQVRQALSPEDLAYLKERASPRIVRQVRAERREVVRRFLVGLKEDFSRLDRLARTVAALSPEISRAQEAERFWLGLRFRILYALVQLKLASGWVSLPQLGRLTELIGSLAAQMERAMAALEQASIEQLRSNLSA
jgi:HAMP domain-containing protein